LELVEANKVGLFVSPLILAEIRDVLTRRTIQDKFPHLTSDRVEVFQQKIALMAKIVDPVPDAGYGLRDKDDLPYLNLAIAASVRWLVSRDKDLLELMNDSQFVQENPELGITTPEGFLAIARQAV